MATIGTLAVNIVARTQKFSSGIMKAQRLAARMGVGLAAVGAAGVAAGVALTRSYEQINRAMTKSLAIMGDVSDTMRKDMVEAANRVAKETEASTAQAAESYFFLASAGMSAEQSLKAMPVVARFAQAGNFDLALATDLATDAQSALGLSSKDTETSIENLTKVTDVLVKANTLANASVQQFSEALTNGAAAALRLVNKDMTEGVAVLAAYADQGIKGAEAGTAFGIVMRDLQTKAIQNKTAFRAAGVAVFDATGNMNNLADIVEDLEGLLSGLSDEQSKLTLLQLGFSDKSVKYIQSLIGMSDKIRDYEKNLQNAGGTAAEVAAKSMTDLQRATEQLQGAWDKLAISFGNAAEKLGVFQAAAEAAEGAALLIDKAVEQSGGKPGFAQRVQQANPQNQFERFMEKTWQNALEPLMPNKTDAVEGVQARWEAARRNVAAAGGEEAFAAQQRKAHDQKVIGDAFARGFESVLGTGRRASMKFGQGVDALTSAWNAAERASGQRALGHATGGLFGTLPNMSGRRDRENARQQSIAELERQLQMSSLGGGRSGRMGSLSLTRAGSVESYRLRRRMENQKNQEGNKAERSMDKTLKEMNKKLSGGVVLTPSNVA